MILTFLALLVLHVSTSTVASVDDVNADVVYLGCYSTTSSYTKDKALTIKHFTWESCLALCRVRDTRYAGFDASKKKCYCGHFLAENSVKLTKDKCKSFCRGGALRSCGGHGRMTLYQMRDSTAAGFLIAGVRGISYMRDNRTVLLIPFSISLPQPYLKINYHYKRNAIYFCVDKKLYRSSFSFTTNQFSEPKLLSKFTGVVNFAIDWLNDRIYWLRLEGGTKLFESDLNGSKQRSRYSATGDVVNHDKFLAIDPYDGKILRPSGSGYQIDHINSRKEWKSLGQYSPSPASPVVFDTHFQTAYTHINGWVMRMQYSNKTNEHDFKDNVVKVPGTFQGLTVVNGGVFYSTSDSSENLNVYSLVPPSVLHLGTPTLNEYGGYIIAYHELVQAPTKAFACRKAHCSHQCVYSPQYSVQCACPNYKILDTRSGHCSNVKGSRSSHNSSMYTTSVECSSNDSCKDKSEEDEDSYEGGSEEDADS